jgi:sigma-B regulation protein RsbU (phosphoserine phosphatase)
MVETRACLRTLTLMSADVSSILMRTNHRLTEDFANEQFVTLILARLEPRTRSFVYTSAGHMAGYVLDHAGALKTELMSTSYPLGVDLGFDFPAAPPLTLQPGEIVLLLTDGVVDARSPDSSVFGVERALNVVRANRSRPAREVVEALYRAVREFSQNASQHDDITAVVVKVNESGA